MAPSAISLDSTNDLAIAAITKTISKSANSLMLNGMSNEASGILPELDASKIHITRTTQFRPIPVPDSPEVWSQSTCTDHMITAKWTGDHGWEDPELKPYGPFFIMPTASVLHYATECFEGLKVYRGYDGKLRLFRPDRNCARMLISSTRISLPAFPPLELEKLIKQLVAVDGPKWLPKSRPGSFLYLRPSMIGTGAALGVQKPGEAMLFIIACYFPSFDEPALQPSVSCAKLGMRLLASRDDMVRAWPGGFGYAKVGSNYGPSLLAQGEARERGYDQILWLFGPQGYVTEAGASNFFVVWRTRDGRVELVTAPLDDKIILDGVTRRSVLDLSRERLLRTWKSGDGIVLEGLDIVERHYTMGEIEEAIVEGRLIEAFGAGTAVSIVNLIA